MRKIKFRPKAFRLWLSAVDPGLIRLLTAGRAALAIFSIWLLLRAGMQILYGPGGPPIPLFGVITGIVLILFIIDLKPAERKVSLWLAAAPFAGGMILASTLAENFWLNNLILLVLFFCSYFFRRYGARAGELALVTTVGYYLGFLLDPPQAAYPLLLACIAFSALAVYLWQFVIIPYDPYKNLVRSVRAFYHNVARGVEAVRAGLEAGQGGIPNTTNLRRHYQVVHRNRRVIEGLFSAIVSPALWSQPRLSRLQEEMFKTERGLELLIEASGKLSSQLDELPEDVLNTLIEGLAALEELLWGVASGEGQTRLTEAGEALHRQVTASLAGKPPTGWVSSLQRMGIAARQLAQSVAEIHAIGSAWKQSAAEALPAKPPATPSQVSLTGMGKKSGIALHPTSILGLQAVLATGLAMLAAYLLRLDSPQLVFWTAFVVIAGSTGESLRRITMRVIGVIAGTLIGVGLAVLLPDNVTLTALLVAACLFMAVYLLPISYFWMVLWLNIAVLLIITVMGGKALELLSVRPVNTLVGAGIAALVVRFILPIRVQKRFIAALSEFMQAVDNYIERYVETMTDASAESDLADGALAIDASYKKLELTLPSITYEYNPLSRSQSRLASQSTSMAVLKGYVTNLEDDVGAEPGSLADPVKAELLRGIQARIHTTVEAVTLSLAEGVSEEGEARADSTGQGVPAGELSSAGGRQVEALRDPAAYHLLRIQDTILQIAAGLGVAAPPRHS